jgi:hypothetical protein
LTTLNIHQAIKDENNFLSWIHISGTVPLIAAILLASLHHLIGGAIDVAE